MKRVKSEVEKIKFPRPYGTGLRVRSYIDKINKRKIFENWLLSKKTIEELAREQNMTRQTLNNWFKIFWKEEIKPRDIDISNLNLIIDEKYLDRKTVCLIGIIDKKVANWKFLNEKTYSFSFTPTGKRKWHYAHKNLHAFFSHLKNALPYLFQYISHPTIPNTTNYLEGEINSQIQHLIINHRGLNLEKRKYLI